MLLDFTISNFKSFNQPQTLSFLTQKGLKEDMPQNFVELGRHKILKSSVLFGANASGKSNLIKALVWFRHFVLNSFQIASNRQDIAFEEFLLNQQNQNRPAEFELHFLIDKHELFYTFTVSKTEVISEKLERVKNARTGVREVLFKRYNDDGRELGLSIEFSKKYFDVGGLKIDEKLLKQNVLLLSIFGSLGVELAEQIIAKIQNIQVVNGLGFNDTLNYSVDHYEKYQDSIMAMMKQADFGIKDMFVKSEELEKAEFLAKESKSLPPQMQAIIEQGRGSIKANTLATTHTGLDSQGKQIDVNFNLGGESTGTQQMFALSAPIINALQEGKTLVVDELDAHLHPFLCRFIILKFHLDNPNNAQLLFTSHSSSLMDHDLLRRDQIWLVDKNKQGESELYSVASLSEKKEYDYQKRYLDGRYGALPYISMLERYEDEYVI